MVDFKKVKAPNNTITRNPAVLAAKADNNIYEAVAIIAKRSNQIAVEMKEELSRKLQEFASYTDNLEEIFENREQIEISKFYERIPKPVLIATQEFEDGQIYFRNPATEKKNRREKIALNSDFNVQFCKCTNVPIIRRIHWYIFS